MDFSQLSPASPYLEKGCGNGDMGLSHIGEKGKQERRELAMGQQRGLAGRIAPTKGVFIRPDQDS